MIWFGLAGYTESLNENDEIVVPDDDYGLQAIDILDPSLVSGLFPFVLLWFVLFLRAYFSCLQGPVVCLRGYPCLV